MFCIKCGMMLDNSAKSCPACGTKMVFPEGFTPEGSPSPAPKAEVILSNEPPHAPDDFDLSKANITYNGKTMLINDEPEIDLDMTMAAPRVAPAAPAPVYSQPVYQAPSSYIPSPVPAAQEEETAEEEAPKSKSKLPLIIGISIAVLVVAVVAIVMLVGKGADEKETNAPSSPAVSTNNKIEYTTIPTPNSDVNVEGEPSLIKLEGVPSMNLVYIIREKDSLNFTLLDCRVGYLTDDPAAVEFATVHNKTAKEYLPYSDIDEIKTDLEKGEINVILISDELSNQILLEKENDVSDDMPHSNLSNDNNSNLIEDEIGQHDPDLDPEENEPDNTATTKSNEASLSAPTEPVTEVQPTVTSD